MQNLTTIPEFDALLDAPTALVYKHSTRCPISAMAYEQVGELSRTHPDAPIALYDLEADPAEQHDVSAAHPEVVRRIRAVMARRTPSPIGAWNFPATN